MIEVNAIFSLFFCFQLSIIAINCPSGQRPPEKAGDGARTEDETTEIATLFFNPFPNKPWLLPVCSTSLENTMGKGEIARNEQFLLFPQCFLPIWRAFYHFHQI